ncbi:MAG: hypothetical protein SFU91_13350 [Chloroherpetonaceae bacterium]|nr:hypothetical protein [Chloroherpetonaceae bacterium]
MRNRNVFVNCPFDNDYFPLFRPLLFSIIALGYRPLLSETVDSSHSRIDQIKGLMKSSQYSIHDLSRVDSIVDVRKDQLPRMNMPFECGFDFGLKYSGVSKFATKRLLVLDRESHRYKTFLSDLSGSDIGIHHNSLEQMIKVVRNWFLHHTSVHLSYRQILIAYHEFDSKLQELLIQEGLNPHNMFDIQFKELILWMSNFLKKY